MYYDLIKLYNYIFGDWADIEKHIKSDLPESIKEGKIKKKKEEIREFFKSIDLRDIMR